MNKIVYKNTNKNDLKGKPNMQIWLLIFSHQSDMKCCKDPYPMKWCKSRFASMKINVMVFYPNLERQTCRIQQPMGIRRSSESAN